MRTLRAVTIDEVREACDRISSIATRTPLIRLPVASDAELFLKLECLQPIGSFKIRGAANAMLLASDAEIARGVYTASAGNMAQGVAWCARERGVPCAVVVPDHAPAAKTDAIERLGATLVRVPFARWWQTLVDGAYPGMHGLFVHPFADAGVMAGNGTIALELIEELDGIDVVLVPLGGGGLACGIAAAMRALSPSTKVIAVESTTAAPLTASLHAGEPTPVEYTRTFIDGMGSASIFPGMWPLLRDLLAGTQVVTPGDVADAVRLLALRARVVSEGAGAAPVAAALSGAFAGKRVVCIVSGGNIDASRLASILQGTTPD